MINWSVDEKRFKKADPKGYRLWRLTQLINYGLDDEEKLDRKEIKRNWYIIKDRLDPDRRKAIDFFSERFEVNASHISRLLQKNKEKIGFEKVFHTEQLGFNFYNLEYPNKDILKIDFSYFPSERVEKGNVWKGLSIDSLYDITLNKYQTIGGSPRAKDYRDAAIKFGIQTDSIHPARQFLRVVEFKDYPKMLVSFDSKEMEKFFLDLAKSLEKDIFK